MATSSAEPTPAPRTEPSCSESRTGGCKCRNLSTTRVEFEGKCHRHSGQVRRLCFGLFSPVVHQVHREVQRLTTETESRTSHLERGMDQGHRDVFLFAHSPFRPPAGSSSIRRPILAFRPSGRSDRKFDCLLPESNGNCMHRLGRRQHTSPPSRATNMRGTSTRFDWASVWLRETPIQVFGRER